MPKLKKFEMQEISKMTAYGYCVTEYTRLIEVIAINHFDIDEIFISVDGATPQKFKLMTKDEEGCYFRMAGRVWDLSEFIVYSSPWAAGRKPLYGNKEGQE